MAGLVLGAVIAAAALFAWWRVDIELHPFAPCWRCKGRGTNRGSRRGAFGICKHGQRRARFTASRAAERHLARRRN